MSRATLMEYDSAPPAVPAYLKALMPKRRSRAYQDIPRIEARLPGLVPDPKRLARYRAVCGFAQSGRLPISFPHVLAFPLHLEVLTHRTFPLGLLGLVHVRNSIRQRRPLGAAEELDLTVHVEGHRKVSNGVEFDLTTRIAVAGEREAAWESSSTMLSRSRNRSEKKDNRRRTRPVGPSAGQRSYWQVPAGIGRRYARVSGDINPIHLSAASARLFGFPRAIAHGMWLLARCAAELSGTLSTRAAVFDVAFKLPVLLPGRVLLEHRTADGHTDLALLSSDGEKPHLTGTIDAVE